MNNKKTVVLTGAGGIIPWGAKKTWDITEMLKKDTRYKSIHEKPIGLWIYEKLVTVYNEDNINFEVMINALEYLFTYFKGKSMPINYPNKNLLPALFNLKQDLIIDFGSERNYSQYFKGVHLCFINLIIDEIKLYSEKAKYTEVLNKNLNLFLNSLNGPIRYYTTNYDRIIPQISEIPFFEGFNDDGEFDMKRVLTDEESNIYYNLHGSAHFEYVFNGDVKYKPKEFISNFGGFATNTNAQNGDELINSNIITGLNKSSRILYNPYSQYYHKLYSDCISTDIIYVIGYSLSDTHINSAIKSALQINPKIKIYFIDCINPSSSHSDNAWVQLGNDQLIGGSNFHDKIYKLIDNNDVEKIKVYRLGFDKFLEKKEWNNIVP